MDELFKVILCVAGNITAAITVSVNAAIAAGAPPGVVLPAAPTWSAAELNAILAELNRVAASAVVGAGLAAGYTEDINMMGLDFSTLRQRFVNLFNGNMKSIADGTYNYMDMIIDLFQV